MSLWYPKRACFHCLELAEESISITARQAWGGEGEETKEEEPVGGFSVQDLMYKSWAVLGSYGANRASILGRSNCSGVSAPVFVLVPRRTPARGVARWKRLRPALRTFIRYVKVPSYLAHQMRFPCANGRENLAFLQTQRDK